ncbi:MAG: lycopene cyclase domain-containing protein [Chloroflexi bacterium]|nr:lycopene cyclase domain-containing protein [Chloroflexota bacterium]
MPEYTVAAVGVLAGGAAAAWWRGALAGRAWWLGLAVFGAATLVFDLVLTGLPIVTYGPGTTSGLALGPMPIEDLLYGLALYLVAIAAWAPGHAPAAGLAGARAQRPGDGA